MTGNPNATNPAYITAFSTLAIISALSLFLFTQFSSRHAILFLTGSGLGISLFHAAFGFTGGWKKFILKRESTAVRSHILLLLCSSIIFFPFLAKLFPGFNPNAALAPAGVSVLVGAFLFGVGMQLGGGCGSGTLYTVGQGQVDMLVTLCFFIIGAVLGSVHLGWWQTLPGLGKVSLLNELGWTNALFLQVMILLAFYFLVSKLDRKRNKTIKPILFSKNQPMTFYRVIHGPWPLWWGIAGLTLLGLVTLLVAGYPWSITFAYGLWGTKIWAALGGDISSWTYWNSGYPQKALGQSVLKDITSIMNFGIILGAILASSLAGKFIPPDRITWRRVLTAALGGILLGYGARLAFGCNIGAMLGGIASGSLHGWIWLFSAFIGAILGVKLRSVLERKR